MRPPLLRFLELHRLSEWSPHFEEGPKIDLPEIWPGLFLRLENEHFDWKMTAQADSLVLLWAEALHQMARGRFQPRLLLFSWREVEAFLKHHLDRPLFDSQELAELKAFDLEFRKRLAVPLFKACMGDFAKGLPSRTLSEAIKQVGGAFETLNQRFEGFVQCELISLSMPPYNADGRPLIVYRAKAGNEYQELFTPENLSSILESCSFGAAKWVAEQGHLP